MTDEEIRVRKLRYTFLEMWEADAGYVTMGNDAMRAIMSTALSKIPQEVADAVSDDCLLLVFMREEQGCYLPHELVRDKAILGFSETIISMQPEEAEKLLLHEVAHYWLKHRSPMLDDLSNAQYEQQEREAADLVKRWLAEAAADQDGAEPPAR